MEFSMIRPLATLCLAGTMSITACATDAPGPDTDCDLALKSATDLAARFTRGDTSLTYRDATDLAWVAMPEYRQTLAVRGCTQVEARIESAAMAGLRSKSIDARALLREACTASAGPVVDKILQEAREAMREQGIAGLKMLGEDTSSCLPAAAR
jgi:hypothetical protein